MEHNPLLKELVAGQARIEEQVKGVNRRLDMINGSVGKLYERVETSERNLLQHELECPVKTDISEIRNTLDTGSHPGSKEVRARLEKVVSLEKLKIAKEEAATKTSSKWLAALKPVIWLLAGALLYIIVVHLEGLIKVYAGKL